VNKYSRIVFISQIRFSEYLAECYGLIELPNKGVNVEVIEVDGLLKWQQATQAKSVLKDAKRPLTYAELQSLIEQFNNSQTIFICLFWYDWRFARILRLLSKNACQYALNINVTVPKLKMRQNIWLAIKHKLNPVNFLLSLFIRTPCNFFGIKQPNYLLSGGDKCVAYEKAFGNIPRILRLHAFDYDRFLVERVNAKQPPEPYVVFLDQMLVEHPDLLQVFGKDFIDIDLYYSLLDKMFDRFENKFRTKVIIAAHPRQKPELLNKRFGKRTCHLGRTSELVRDSSGVLLHFSAAVSYAILYGKPCLFLDFEEFRQFHNHMRLQLLGELIHSPIVDLRSEEIPPFLEKSSATQNAYKQFINDYIKCSGSGDLRYWDLFLKEVSQ
jgi:hypothetical protein